MAPRRRIGKTKKQMSKTKKMIVPASKASANEHLVADEDRIYYQAARVVGLRQQLEEAGLGTEGRKYDLYMRLADAGIPLYTDNRVTSDEEGETNGGQEDDNKGGKPAPEAGDKRQRDGHSDGSGSDGSDESDGIDYRDDGDDGRDAGQPQGPPPRRSRRIAAVLPPEVQITLIESLHPSALWNLIDVAPEEYLNDEPQGGLNALVLEAQSYYALDHPPPPNPEDDGDNSNNDDGDDDDDPRPMSLLEWVGTRATYDSEFRRLNTRRVLRVIDTYLAIYGPDNPAPANGNPRDDILYYFRDRNGILIPGADMHEHTPLGLAALEMDPVAVQLLIMRGAPMNEVLRRRTPLDHVMFDGLDTSVNDTHVMQVIFTLLGAGVDVGVVRRRTRRRAYDVLSEFGLFAVDPHDNLDAQAYWPRINNPLNLSMRQFIANERSVYFDRILLAMYSIWRGTFDYPRFA